jgi:hypothetical protein
MGRWVVLVMVPGEPLGNHDEDVVAVLLLEGLFEVSSALLLLCVGESPRFSLRMAATL